MNQRALWGLLMSNLQSPNWTIIIDTSSLVPLRFSGGLGTPMTDRTGPSAKGREKLYIREAFGRDMRSRRVASGLILLDLICPVARPV